MEIHSDLGTVISSIRFSTHISQILGFGIINFSILILTHTVHIQTFIVLMDMQIFGIGIKDGAETDT